jgi:hypothetical protein
MGKKVDLLLAEGCAGGQTGGETRRVARRASNLDEYVLAILNGRGTGGAGAGGRGLIQEFHESHERQDVGGIRASNIEARRALRCSVGGAIGILFALIGEILIGHAHLHVVCFACEDLKRFVLCLPPKARDSAIVATGIHVTIDAEKCLAALGIASQVLLNRCVGDGFYQPASKGRSWDAEDDIAGI